MASCIPTDSVDPDVAGIGVLISFAISSLITIVVIVVAYIRQALRPDRYSPLDKIIIGLAHRPTVSARARTQRVASLESFLKALSDQQLFTALALTLTIYLVRYGAPGFDTQVSAYSFCLAVNIALLSSTVHLSATTILRDHFDNFKWLRNVRVMIMVTTISCLIPQLVLTQIMDPSITLRCALRVDELSLDLSWSGDLYDTTVFIATFAIVLVLICGYVRRLLELYSPLFRESPERWAASVFHYIFQWPSAAGQDRLSQNTASYFERQCLKVPTYDGMVLYGQVMLIVGSEFGQSFFTEIIWLLFYTTFSLCQMIFFITWSLEPGESPISLKWGFGQVLPLVLLGLPIVSAVEFYQEWASNNLENERSVEFQHLRHAPRDRTNSNPLPASTQDDHLGLYDLCLNYHKKVTIVYTWLFVVVYAALVISGALVFSWAIWGTFITSDEIGIVVAFHLTMAFFSILGLGLLSSLILNLGWVGGRNRFTRPPTR